MADDCPKCGEGTDASAPCADCRRRIHEGWHAKGWWWIRPEECHPDCPGVKQGRVQVQGYEHLRQTEGKP